MDVRTDLVILSTPLYVSIRDTDWSHVLNLDCLHDSNCVKLALVPIPHCKENQRSVQMIFLNNVPQV